MPDSGLSRLLHVAVEHARLQLLTIEELLEGGGIDRPPVQASATFKKAPKAKQKVEKNIEMSFDGPDPDEPSLSPQELSVMGIFKKRGDKAVQEAGKREDLVRALQANPRTQFSANDLHKLTGVGKGVVRELLEDVVDTWPSRAQSMHANMRFNRSPAPPITASGREPVDE